MLDQLKHDPIKREIILVTHLAHATVRTSIHEWSQELVERAEQALSKAQYTINSASLTSALSYYYIVCGKYEKAYYLLHPFIEAAPTKKTRSFIWEHIDLLYVITCFLLDEQTVECQKINDRITIRDEMMRYKLAFLQFTSQSNFNQAEEQLNHAYQCCKEWSFMYGDGKIEKELLNTLKKHLEKIKK